MIKFPYKYTNGNAEITILNDGTRIIRYPDNEPLTVEYPLNIDCKITNYCDLGDKLDNDGNIVARSKTCEFCHEKSHNKGEHADLEKLWDIWQHTLAGTEIACLDGKTKVLTPNGLKNIEDINIGDFIISPNGKIVKVINVNKTVKDAIQLKAGKGFSVVSSKDHPFMSEGVLQKAEDMKGKVFDISKNIENFKIEKIVDMGCYITSSNETFGRCGKVYEKTVKISHVSKEAVRFVSPNKDIMWLYGITVAEGSKRNIVLNIKEDDLADKAIKIYSDFFLDGVVKGKKIVKDNSIIVEFYNPEYYNRLFFDGMEIGKGARNKSIKYLFGLDKELIRSALYGMFQGDGCFRKRNHKTGSNFSLSYKTSSENIAKELHLLLSTIFGVNASFYHGVNKERYIGERLLKSSDYYKLDIYGNENIKKLFPDHFKSDEIFNTVKIQKNHTLKVEEIIELGQRELYDITLEENSDHLFVIDGGIITHNCGGGDAMQHPFLDQFLYKLRKKGVIANITVNSLHVKRHAEKIKFYQDHRLINGMGISYRGRKCLENLPTNISYKNVVFHMILGIDEYEDVLDVMDFARANNFTPKLLFLGYKQYGNGNLFYSQEVQDKINKWKKDIVPLLKNKNEMVISFDNLGIDQIELKNHLTQEQWDRFYNGPEGSTNLFIDGVNCTYTKNSTCSNRKPLESLKKAFDDVRNW